ncbi:MAG: branched-chain amino acid ABC transporter permease [Desulfurococcaceae archaeon]|jgi:branched-chain amino acid transport system permease protein|nr:branched-chain amino acid ABC transporter permease [Desulfurococcaceae archaeon]
MYVDIYKYILLFSIFHSSTYLTFSLGFSMLFGVAKIPNLAYGSLYILSAYVMYALTTYIGLEPLVAALVAILVAGLASLLIGEVVVKPGLKMPVSVFITTLSVAYIFEEFFRIEMGLRPITLPVYPGVTYVLGVPVSNHWFLILSASLLMFLSLTAFLKYAVLGRSIRAVAESWDESRRLGIDPLKVLRVAFFVAGVYAGATGVLLTPLKALTPTAGWGPLFTAFAIVALGGVGSVTGTLIASFIYGFFEQSMTYVLGSGVASISPLILIVLVLVFRPQGLMGRVE